METRNDKTWRQRLRISDSLAGTRTSPLPPIRSNRMAGITTSPLRATPRSDSSDDADHRAQFPRPRHGQPVGLDRHPRMLAWARKAPEPPPYFGRDALTKPLMRSQFVMISDVVGDHAPHASLAQNQDVIQALPPDAAVKSLDERVGNSCRMHPMRRLSADASGSPILFTRFTGATSI